MRILMLDNYDSFTYNLVHLFEELGAEVVTVRNDAITLAEALAGRFDRLVVSPGPGEMTTPRAWRASASSADAASFRRTSTSAPSAASN